MNFLLFHTLEYILCRGKWNPDDCIQYKGRVLNIKWGFSSLVLHFPTLSTSIAVLFSDASSHFSVSFRVYLWRFHHKKNKQKKHLSWYFTTRSPFTSEAIMPPTAAINTKVQCPGWEKSKQPSTPTHPAAPREHAWPAVQHFDSSELLRVLAALSIVSPDYLPINAA